MADHTDDEDAAATRDGDQHGTEIPGSRFMVPATVFVVAVVPIIAAIVAWSQGWVPYGDEAGVVAQSWGSLTSSPPLHGVFASVRPLGSSGPAVYHPGPVQLWFLGVPTRLFAPSVFGALVGAAMIASAGIVLLLVVAYRRGGRWWFASTVVVTAWFMHGMGAHSLRMVYNASASMYMAVGFVAAVWAVLDRDEWFWPVAVGCGSVAAQSEVTWAVPVAAVIVVVVAVRGVSFVSERGDRDPDPIRARRGRRIGLVSIVVGLSCWSGPLIDQFAGSGNLARLLSSGTSGRAVGVGYGLNRLVDAATFPAPWMTGGLRGHGSILANGVVTYSNTPSEYVRAVVFGSVFVWAMLRSVRWRNRGLVALGSVAVAFVAGCVIASGLLPDNVASLLGHTDIWWVASFVAWLFPVIVVVEAIRGWLGERAWRGGRIPTVTVSVAVVLGVLVPLGLVLAGASPSTDTSSIAFGAVDRFARVAAPTCRRSGRPVLVDQNGLGTVLTALGLVAELQLRGCTVHVRGDLAVVLPGAWLRPDGHESTTFLVSDVPRTGPATRLLAVYDTGHPSTGYRDFVQNYEFMPTPQLLYLYEVRR
ncbi:MAG: hypothetical protein JST73_09885 [Actinobacteria bacterium]|nr:hypothetical protein [Actinomycetota bacterium]